MIKSLVAKHGGDVLKTMRSHRGDRLLTIKLIDHPSTEMHCATAIMRLDDEGARPLLVELMRAHNCPLLDKVACHAFASLMSHCGLDDDVLDEFDAAAVTQLVRVMRSSPVRACAGLSLIFTRSDPAFQCRKAALEAGGIKVLLEYMRKCLLFDADEDFSCFRDSICVFTVIIGATDVTYDGSYLLSMTSIIKVAIEAGAIKILVDALRAKDMAVLLVLGVLLALNHLVLHGDCMQLALDAGALPPTIAAMTRYPADMHMQREANVFIRALVGFRLEKPEIIERQPRIAVDALPPLIEAMRAFPSNLKCLIKINLLIQAPVVVSLCCTGCGATAALKKCKGCGVASYCGMKCMRDQWPQHKRYCSSWRLARSVD
ncbi:hypothetical protein T492DRAFT_971993 [Pavlovales sp. CCMP2436]|nr:hypothetical protein T492DRAFT_971993 [Pavlovales sp. CCMP2436]|mmetsp:Transcript_45109/g.111859  ORF Transcript_45109/g.111859 Transcript_45109/m.111859 type:complete len:374 (+) Transcript_45109:30-1151(+)|eukprot:CAMPEP_0179886286 /NCGR_PEP_ID=MMETSP0982-20121206/30761_1 /TAXON_ID=483367 /ORGANISM="non described non described, Strain CCMP 2436" /LENGTH=373 /DNA_ID=CAMNT_0021781979 /DNA_START=19 /DNA_END=1140 /DNA_ORIENTATION=+